MFVRVAAEKLVGGTLLPRGQIYSKTFIKLKYTPYRGKYPREKVFVGENFCRLSNISSFFPDKKFTEDIMNIFDVS